MVVQNVYKKRPYWIDSLEDRPTAEGFQTWKTSYVSNILNLQKANFKFNQLNFETYELCWNKATVRDNFPNLYFEILVNKKTYYLYVEHVSRIYNGGAVYICKIDNWATYCVDMLNKLKYSTLDLYVVRGHFEVDDKFLPDEKLEEVYAKMPKRNTNMTFLMGVGKFSDKVVVPDEQRIISNNIYAVFQQDNIDNPFLIIPVPLKSGSFTQDGKQYCNSGEFVQQLLVKPELGFANKFAGLFAGPVYNTMNYTETTVRIDNVDRIFKISSISNSAVIEGWHNTSFDLSPKKPNNTYINIYTLRDEEFWKLNTADKAKSFQMLNLLEYKLGSTRLNLPRMINRVIPSAFIEYEFRNWMTTFFNGEFVSIMANPNLNREERILKYSGSLPSASSGYATQVQGIYNQTNTGLQIAKENYIRGQGYNLFEGLIGGIFSGANAFGKFIKGDIGGAVETGFSTIYNPVKTGIENAYSYNQKKRQIAAQFKDMQKNALPVINNSLDQHILDYANETEGIYNILGDYNGSCLNDVRISRNWVSKGNIIEMNNTITKYGYYYWDYFRMIELVAFGGIDFGKFSYFQIEATNVNTVVQPFLTKNFDNTTPRNVIWDFCTNLIDGIRVWNKKDNEYVISTTKFNDEVWNG